MLAVGLMNCSRSVSYNPRLYKLIKKKSERKSCGVEGVERV